MRRRFPKRTFQGPRHLFKVGSGAVVLAAAVAAVAVAVPTADAASAKKPELKLMDPYSNNNPAIASLADLYGINVAYAALIHEEPNGSLSPELAASWKYLGGQHRTFQISLRSGATFADGSPITASSVKTWIAYFDKTSSSAADLGKIKSIRVMNRLELRIFLSAPDPVLPYAFSDQNTAGYIAAGKCAKTPSLFTSHPVECSSGEFVYVPSQSVPTVHATFAPNRHYFDLPAVKFSKVYIAEVADPASAVQGLESGEFNVIGGVGMTASTALSSGHKVYSGGEDAQMNLALDASGAVAKPLGDVLVREAINYALNRKALAQAFGGPYAGTTDEMLTVDGYDPSLKSYYSYDPAKASALLKTAGYPNGFTLNNVIAPGFPPFTGLEGLIAQELSNVGITVNFTYESQLNTWFQALLTSTSAPMEITPDDLVPMWAFYSSNLPAYDHFGGTGWSDPVMAKDFAAGLTAKNPTPDWKAITDRLVRRAYFAPLLVSKVVIFADKDVKGIHLTSSRVFAPPTEWSIS